VKGGVWKLLRSNKCGTVQQLKIGTSLTSDKKLIAEEFKNTFTSKVKQLRKNPDSDAIILRLKERLGCVTSGDLRECTPDEVASCIEKIKPSSLTGPDGVSNRTLKILKFQIVEPLTALINASITSGRFPNIWKIGRVCPTFKRGAKVDSANYRPISLTSNIGKLVEAVIRIQFSEAPRLHCFNSSRKSKFTKAKVVRSLYLL